MKSWEFCKNIYQGTMIEVNNLTASQIGKEFLKKVAKKVLKGENKEGLELSIALVGQSRIRKLNKKYRGNDRPTDVLSFPADTGGELIICLSEVKKNAKRYSLTFQEELAKVLIHGVLHLLGYEHEKSATKADRMRKKEEHYLEISKS